MLMHTYAHVHTHMHTHAHTHTHMHTHTHTHTHTQRSDWVVLEEEEVEALPEHWEERMVGSTPGVCTI